MRRQLRLERRFSSIQEDADPQTTNTRRSLCFNIRSHPGDLIEEQQDLARLHPFCHSPEGIAPVLIYRAGSFELTSDLPGKFLELICSGRVPVRGQSGEDTVMIEMAAELLDQSALTDPAPASDHYLRCRGLARGLEETRERRTRQISALRSR